MKNLTKIFFAVVAGMFAFSCVTDTTEDLGVKLEGQGGVYEVAVSLEATKTQLGEKVDGLYPLYWSEGDAIAINGVVSNPLAAGGSADATFQFNEEVYRPYCVVYPASAAVAVEEGEEVTPAPVTVYPVTFAATQPYTVGTFAPGVAPMYGYAAELAEGEELAPIQLNHLTGVLRLAVKGNGEKVTSVVVKTEKGTIAGPYTVDCTNGTLVAQPEATNTITVTFADGLVLGEEAQHVYVAVPAGSYGTFLVTINTEANNKMTVKFNSDVKPIKVGTVREFSEFTYQENSADTENAEYLIDSAEALINFAKIAPSFYPRTKAIVTADIDMTGIEWTPIVQFGAYEFDGGNFTIKGLSAPLFNVTAANIKNVKLTDVNYTVTDLAFSGAIACQLYGSIDNCSAEGTININNTIFAPEKVTDGYNEIAHGGLVGFVHAASVTNCVNNINITITSLCEPSKTIKSQVGGVVGGVQAHCSCEGLTNNGTITYVGTTQKGNLYISGVVGKNDTSSEAVDFDVFSNCVNNAALSTAKGSKSAGDILIAGITGCLDATTATVCDKLENHGAITLNGECVGMRAAGIASYTSHASLTNCTNTANITLATGAQAKSAYLAGIVSSTLYCDKVDNCSNSGNLYIGDGIKFAGVAHLEGVLTATANNTAETTPALVTNLKNTGTLYCGNCTNTATSNGGRLIMAGVVGSVHDTKLKDCVNEATGTITAKTGEWASRYMIGGVAAYVAINNTTCPESHIIDCENNAAILIDPVAAVNSIQLGGITCEAYVNKSNETYWAYFTRAKNSGAITINGDWTSGWPYAGGILGINNHDNIVIKDCENSGKITFNGTSVKPCIGGIVGLDDNNYQFEIDGCVNSGDIEFNSVVTEQIRLGGIVGTRVVTAPLDIKNCTNLGAITVADQTFAKADYVYHIGGIIGKNEKAGFTISGCTNGSATDATKGAITFGNGNAGVCLAGIVGLSSVAITVDGCKNYGTVKQTGIGGNGDTYRAHIAGILSKCNANDHKVNNCENYGNIEYGTKTPGGRVDVAGIVATTANTSEITNCKNGGKIEYKGEGAGKEISVGGIVGVPGNTLISDCVNLASAEIIGSGTTSSGYDIAGIGGGPNNSNTQFLRCKNYGHIKQTTVGSNSTYVGGIAGYGYSFGSFIDCENHGPISAVGSTGTAYVGGIIGWARIAADTNTSASTRIMRNCVNYYDINFNFTSGTAAGTAHAGGIAGRLNDEDADRHWEEVSGCKNYGNLTFSSNVATSYYGGLFGSVAVSSTDKKYTAGGTRDNKTPYALAEMTGCVNYGNLKCLGGKKVSLLVGVARSTSCKFINSSAGGNMIFATETGEDANGDKETFDVLTPITADNLKDYLYSSAVTAAVVEEDQITLLTEKPAEATHTHPKQ